MTVQIQVCGKKKSYSNLKGFSNPVAICDLQMIQGQSYAIVKDGPSWALAVFDQNGIFIGHAYFREISWEAHIHTIPKPYQVYLSKDGKKSIQNSALGFVFNPSINNSYWTDVYKFATGPTLETKMSLRQNEMYEFVSIMQQIRKYPQSAVTESALYRLFVQFHNSDPCPALQNLDMKKIEKYADAPVTDRKKISKIMRMFAWQAGIDVPRENWYNESHYGHFPLNGFSRIISEEQKLYLNILLAAN